MRSGRIEQFTHLSEFTSVKEFNSAIEKALRVHGDHFTNGERIAFDRLTRFSVKIIGICNARICKLVQACQSTSGGISRSTFQRMLRKAKSLGIISIFQTVRNKGGHSHNVYVFHRIDKAKDEQLTLRQNHTNPTLATVEEAYSSSETKELKTNNSSNKDIRTENIDTTNISELDATFVPDYVPNEFVKAVKPFFKRATEICGLWDRAIIAFRLSKFDPMIQTESFLPLVIQVFRQTVYQYKKGRIRTTFRQYYYGFLYYMFIVEKRKIVAAETKWWKWLES